MVRQNREKKLPVTSTHQCFHLMYFLLYHMGCLGCKIKNDKEIYFKKSYRYYGYICRTAYLTCLIWGFAYKMYDAELSEALLRDLTPVIKVILTFECTICPTVYLAITISLDMNRETYTAMANTLQNTDDELHKYFPGIQWNYSKSKRKYSFMTVGMYGFYAITSTIYIFYVANCMCGWKSSLMISICYACISGAPACAEFLFIGNLDMLRLRFRLIRKLLRQHSFHSNNMEDITKFK